MSKMAINQVISHSHLIPHLHDEELFLNLNKVILSSGDVSKKMRAE